MAISLSTLDNANYNFFPVTSGQIKFRVKAANDAYIALSTGPAETNPLFEVIIGESNNTKAIIRKNKIDLVETETSDLIDGSEFTHFSIRWKDGALIIDHDTEKYQILVAHDTELFGITHVGFRTDEEAKGVWQFEGKLIMTSPGKPYEFTPILKGCLEVEVIADHGASIALTRGSYVSSPMYEVGLGVLENTASVIKYNFTEDKINVKTVELLSRCEYRKFTLTWFDGYISVKMGDQRGVPVLEWRDTNAPFPISHIGVRTVGASGNWILKFQHVNGAVFGSVPRPMYPPNWRPAEPVHYVHQKKLEWISTSGINLPPGATVGGQESGEPLYVGRATHETALTPGKVKLSLGGCCISWGESEHLKNSYQVLCNCLPQWVAASNGHVPLNALPGGRSESGELLYIARVHHQGSLTLGKVHPSHRTSYIPWDGSEMAYRQYEVLVYEDEA